jgi:hypothetical protein
MSDETGALRDELRADVPRGIAALPAADRETLTRLVRDARHRQRAALEQALDDGLGFVPRMLRGPVKKALGL